ncbi:hypothetical protein HZF02_17020 [Pseudomonas yamanorum]|nr:hypothetical protein HZF02_17020 [Pseudomonas yamanorum]
MLIDALGRKLTANQRRRPASPAISSGQRATPLTQQTRSDASSEAGHQISSMPFSRGVSGKSNRSKKMNEAQIERVREIVQELAEKSGISFDAAFDSAIGVMRYHAIDVVPWGKPAANGSGGVEEG